LWHLDLIVAAQGWEFSGQQSFVLLKKAM